MAEKLKPRQQMACSDSQLSHRRTVFFFELVAQLHLSYALAGGTLLSDIVAGSLY